MTLVTRLLNCFRKSPVAEAQTAGGDVFAMRLNRMHTRNGVTCRKTPFKSSRQRLVA